MRKQGIIILLIFLCVLPLTLFAQSAKKTYSSTDWVGMMRDNTVNVHDVQKAFYKWYKKNHTEDKDKDKTKEKGEGEGEEEGEDEPYEQFKRWEWYNLPRSDLKGNRADQYRVASDFEKFLHKPTQEDSSQKNSSQNNSSQNQPVLLPSSGSWSYAGNTTVPTNSSSGDGGDGRVNRVRVFPGNNNIIYACAASGGLWKTTNGGTTWATATDQLGDLSTSDIAINPLNTNIMYLATGDGDGIQSIYPTPATIGVLKSTDGGNTWNATGLAYTLSSAGTNNYSVNELLIDPTDTNIILAATTFGIYRSTNSGATWTQTQTGWFHSMEFEPSHPSIVYAASSTLYGEGAQFYRSSNNGASFTLITSGLPSSSAAEGFEIGVSAADTADVYVLADNSSNYGYEGLYLSTNHGISFSTQSTSPNLLGWTNDGSDVGGQGWYTLSMAVSQTNADSIYIGGVNIWASSNGGVSWTVNSDWTGFTGPYVHADIHHIQFISGSSASYVAGCDGGVFITSNSGKKWTDISNNLGIGQQYSIGPSASTAGRWLTGWQDNGTNLSSSPWSQVYGGDGMVCFIDWSNNNTFYAENPEGSLEQSTNAGASWNNIVTGITENGPWVTEWLQDPKTSTTLYSGFSNVWKSTNSGGNWSAISTWGGSGSITALAVDSSNTGYIYAAQSNIIEVTTNGGTNWTNITGTLPVNSASISAIAVSAKSPNHVWVTFSGYSATSKVFASTNSGSTWTNISTGLPNLPVNCIVSQSGSPNGIYVGTDQGVYYHDTTLNSWIFYNTGLPMVMIGDLKIFKPGQELLAATYGRGTWETPLYESSSVAAPTAYFKATPTTICAGNTVQFTDTSHNSPTSWSWTFTGGTPATSIAQNPSVVYSTAGNYTVALKVTNASGSDSLTKTSYITVNSNPTITASPTPASYCPGGSSVLTASGGSTYTWSPSTNLSAMTGATITANPTVTTIYKVTGTNSSGCSAANTVTVTVNPTPTITAAPNPASYCPGGNSILTASGGSTYTWSPATNLSATSGAIVTANPAATATYTVTVTNSSGCSATKSVTVTVNSVPTITVLTPAAICSGIGSATLTASGGNTYSWSPSINLSATTGAIVTANPTTTTTYTVTGTNSSGCSASSTTIVTVNPAPIITASPSPASYCPGGNSILTASGGNTYTWSPATNLSATTGAIVTASPTLTTAYTVTGANSSGCSTTKTVTITVNQTPTITATPSPALYCPGGNSTLTASGGSTYTWSPATNLSSTTGATVTANPTITTTYTLTGTNSSGCSATKTLSVTVNPTPTITASPSPTSYCQGGNSTITASGGSTYTWSPSTNLSATTGATVIANPTITTTYTVTGTNSSGCSAAKIITVTVNPTPTITASPSPASYCPGGSSTITASGGSSYTWSPSIDLSVTNGATVTANPTVTTIYTITGKNSGGCSAIKTVTVTVNPTPTITASPSPASYCPGGSSTLTASGASTYTWSASTDLSSTTGATVIASPNITTTYTVTGTNSGGCSAAKNVTVTVNQTPTIITSPSPASYCPGGNSILTASGGSTYTWSPSTNLTAATGAIVTASPTTTTTYTVTGTNSSGCSATKTVSVTVNPTPTITASPSPASYCPGGNSILTASGGSTYTWSPSTNLSAITGVTVTTTIGTTTTYTVTGTNANGCVNTATVEVIVSSSAIIAATALPSSYCESGSSTLTAYGGSTYTWSPSTDLTATTGAIVTASPTATTVYIVTGSSGIGCSGSTTITVTVNSPPNKPDITRNGGVLTSSATQGNQWMLDDTAIQGATGQTYTITKMGCYSVTASNLVNGCSSSSDTVCVIQTGINKLSVNSNNQLSIYPNPSSGQFTIKLQGNQNEYTVEAYNVIGEKIYQSVLSNSQNTINLNSQPPGMYLIYVKSDEGVAIGKVILTR
jgi:PKD repeat protein